MMTKVIISIVFAILTLHFIDYSFNSSIIQSANLDSCPFCYGEDFCSNLTQDLNTLTGNTLIDIFHNYFGSKNVIKVTISNKQSVVLKKLAHSSEFAALDEEITDLINNSSQDVFKQKLLDIMLVNSVGKVNSLKVCSEKTAKEILVDLLQLRTVTEDYYKNLWTSFAVNPEGIVLQLLQIGGNNDWPIPNYYGACGRIIAVENCGQSLNYFLESDWLQRSYLALQILQAADKFTDFHGKYRFYLTDISPDNIVVGDKAKITFVDFENLIISSKESSNVDFGKVHSSKDFSSDDNEGFAYSEDDICSSELSDHNYYAVCKLLLSKDSPWPMISHGLLHSPPNNLETNQLFQLIDDCVQNSSSNRFKIVQDLLKELQSYSEIYLQSLK